MVERAGRATSGPSRRARSSRSLRAPQLGRSRRSATIAASTGIGSRFATRPGRRGRSASASSPWSFQRASSLWPVLREMPNSRHSAVIVSPSSRRATKRSRSSMGVVSLHGIHTSRREKAESVTHVPGTNCHPCPRPLTVLRISLTGAPLSLGTRRRLDPLLGGRRTAIAAAEYHAAVLCETQQTE